MSKASTAEQLVAKILVVDDRNENLFAMEQILKALNCKIYQAHSGNEALSLTLRYDFALILLDVNMPQMDGFELAELLRGNEQTDQIPIIFVTAINKEDKSVFKGYESGAVDYLFKPIDTDILLSKVRVFLELNLKRKELEAIQSELQRSNDSLKEFAQVVSHDLRNPLNVVSGLSELVLKRYSAELGDKGKECIVHISNAAERMMRLVTDLLIYSQFNASSAQYTAVDLNAIIEDVRNDLSSRIDQTKGQIVVADPLSIIEADQTQMYQLFLNLIGNGIKYHHMNRPPIVRISVEHSDQPEYCQLLIADNGIGMKEAEIEQIFLPFIRLDSAKAFEGSGLGLATVKKIIATHQGSIAVQSTLGEGSSFRVKLRMKQ